MRRQPCPAVLKFKFWEWIEPFIGKETLCQAFLIHGQRIYLQILNPFLDFIQELLINPVFHITDGNVSVGALSGRCYFHGKPGIADSPPNQGRIKIRVSTKPSLEPRMTLSFSGSLTPREG